MTARVSMPASTVASTEVTIERMRRRDLRQVLRIEERTSSTPWSLGLFLAEVRRAERCYLVARDTSASGSRSRDATARDAGGAETWRAEGAVVGYAGMLFVLDEGHITTVAVDPARQGGRIGTRLMVAMLRDAIERGVHDVTLEVRASNDAAIALYRRFGFAPAGVRANYYADPVEDALVLWAHDVHTADYAARLEGIARSLEMDADSVVSLSLEGDDLLDDDLLDDDGFDAESTNDSRTNDSRTNDAPTNDARTNEGYL